MVDELIATLGGNPLPIVVSALTRKATVLHLVMTPQVESLGERIWTLLESGAKRSAGKHVVARGERVVLSDAATSDVARLRSELLQSNIPWASADLDYTGGTKLMSAQVGAWWREQNPAGTSSYLTEKGRLVWGRRPGDPGSAWSPAEASLTFQELARLHFGQPLRASDDFDNTELGAAAGRIFDYVRESGFEKWMELLPPFRPRTVTANHIMYEGANALRGVNLDDDKPLMQFDVSKALGIVGLGTTIDQVADAVRAPDSKPDSRKKDKLKKREATLKWLEGIWLEIAFAGLLRKTKLFDEVHQDVKQEGTAKGDDFQVDVVGVKGYRAYLFTWSMKLRRPRQCATELRRKRQAL